MYRLALPLLLAFALYLIPTIAVEPYQTSQGFVYYWTSVMDPQYNHGDMPSGTLAKYAYNAYKDMEQKMQHRDPSISKHDIPTMVSAMWVPEYDQVIIASGAVAGQGASEFAYHPDNVPTQVTALLRMAKQTKNWVTDHRKGGSCSEIVALSSFFYLHPGREGLPSPTGAKIVTVGIPPSNVGGEPSVQKPCIGSANEGNCREFLEEINIRWCGPADITYRMGKRDSAKFLPEAGFECHAANQPASDGKLVGSVTVQSTYKDTATGTVSIASATGSVRLVSGTGVPFTKRDATTLAKFKRTPTPTKL